MTSLIRTCCLSVGLLIGVQGCVWVDDTSDLRAFIREKLAAPGGTFEPLPELLVYESFVYEGSSQRDPFVPLAPLIVQENDTLPSQSTLTPDFDRIKEYLEGFPIDQLVMVGTISSPIDGELVALVRDTNAEVHQIRLGARMGLDFGVVVDLNERGIELNEIVVDGRGGWISRSRTIKLPGLE